MLGLTYGNAQLLEGRAGAVGGSGNSAQTASSVGGVLVSRAWLRERLPLFASAMEEFHSFFSPGAREKASLFDFADAVPDFVGSALLPVCTPT